MSTAFAALRSSYLDNHAWLVRWVRQRAESMEHAQDVAHDTFLRLVERAAQPCETAPHEITAAPRALLSTIAKGLLIDAARRRAIERAYLDALAVMAAQVVPGPEERHLHLEALLELDRRLAALPARAREVFLLRRLEDLPFAQIAKHMGISLSSVEKAMAQAIRHCCFSLEATR
jgi:RNA polymerase sigma-70 factor (ECF subfamily)